MAFVLFFLAVGVLVYLAWKRRVTTLTRNCRWRLDREGGVWTCAYCNGTVEMLPSGREPTVCMDPARDGYGKL